jgi:hypothetical protein
LQHPIICFEVSLFSISFISKGYISFQASCQIFIDRPARFGQLVTRFCALDFHSGITYRASYTVLLRMPSIFLNSRRPVELWTFQTWLKWASFLITEFEKIEMWIFRFLWWKSKFCSMGILYNTLLFAIQIKFFAFFMSKDHLSL